MTHAELIASIPTKGVECLWIGSKKPVQAMYAEDGTVFLRVGSRNAVWVFQREISPMPEKRRRPMTDREMFGLFAQEAEVRSKFTKEKYSNWRILWDGSDIEYRLPGSTEWTKCEVEVVENG